uniref:Uncharacterized protein n=1 Tax=Arundo donax TaxID=35708 RepID=A0A0A8ZIL0_ARUDO
MAPSHTARHLSKQVAAAGPSPQAATARPYPVGGSVAVVAAAEGPCLVTAVRLGQMPALRFPANIQVRSNDGDDSGLRVAQTATTWLTALHLRAPCQTMQVTCLCLAHTRPVVHVKPHHVVEVFGSTGCKRIQGGHDNFRLLWTRHKVFHASVTLIACFGSCGNVVASVRVDYVRFS